MIPRGPIDIVRLAAPPRLTWRVPGSKSITNRALVLAALAEGESELTGVLESDDTRHMRTALEALGVGIETKDATTIVVSGGRSRLRAPSGPIFIGNSGTSVRFLAALAAFVPGAVTLVGDDAMARRPIADLVDGLRQLGVRVDCETGCPPLTVHGGHLPGGVVRMRGDRSSQYFSALMLTAGAADADVEIQVEGRLVSRPYVEITRRMVADFGGRIDAGPASFIVHATGGYRSRRYAIEPDASSASYPFALAAATGGSIAVPGLGPSALQGDYAFTHVLEQTGASIHAKANETRVDGPQRGGEKFEVRSSKFEVSLRAIDVDMHDISDTVMTLAAIAPLADGPTRIRNIANIRIKETDRLSALAIELGKLGQDVTEGADFLEIRPRPLRPALVHCYADHRIAMSFAVLGLAADGVSIDDPACVAKTYPGFWDDVRACYASVGQAAPW
ncbi:MAG TPA: 3-phosphoshikimate 1-carboxyvinyltransferase [Vicinamibacterales bacterium]|nr:3-phosphoshikimate 1-carboxyvinyltransferase [Vicinamibacterales bacterium]